MPERRVLALGLAALLGFALAPAASRPAAAPRTGVTPDSTAIVQPTSTSATLVPAGSAPAAGCDAHSMLADPGPAGPTEAACVAPDLERDQAYLVETARPGRTMLHQGTALAVVRLHPMFVHRLAAAISEARAAGLPSAGIFSAYRPAAFGVGGFSDKFSSLHTYGLAVDMLGVGGPGSSEAKLWYEIAPRHGIVCPYGAANRREWNHCQPTRVKSIMAGDPLRGTVSPQGPVDRAAMFAMGDALVNGTDGGAGPPELQPADDEIWLSRSQGQPRPQVAAGRGASVETRHDQADPTHERHRRVKSAAGIIADPSLHGAQGQPKRRIVADNRSVKSGPVKNYRTASLVRHDSSVSSHENRLAKRTQAENAKIDRLVKGVCHGC
jgi:hypothetical protein